MKKFFTYPVFVILFLSFIGMMGFGAIVKYHYDGGKKYQFLQKSVMLIAEIPINFRKITKFGTIDINKISIISKSTKHKDKKRFQKYLEKKRNVLLILPRYDRDISRAVIDIIDLNNFDIIHTYKHDINQMYKLISNNDELQKNKKFLDGKTNFLYAHPILLKDGSIISGNHYSIRFKIDFCSNLQWINDEEIFHHSQMIDHEGNIWVGGQINSKSKYIKKYSIENYEDDSIIKLSTDGKILFKKSVTQILIENNIQLSNFALISSLSNNSDPIHLNDIESAFNDTDYWEQGDVFLSIRHQSAIIHYRPSTNKVINYITGPFAQQHDVDIISDKEISIFNNNNFFVDNDYSEVLIYNFETKKFRKLFNDQLQKENFKTVSEGLSHTFKDGSLLVEEQNHGRIILFNNKGKKEWEFVNKDNKGDVTYVSWSRIIEDEQFIRNFKSLIKSKKCLN